MINVTSVWCSFLLACGVALYIVTLATPHIWDSSFRSPDGVTTLAANMGFNKLCGATVALGESGTCVDVGFSNCDIQGFDLMTGRDCQEFEASYVLLILATIFSGMGMLLMFFHTARMFFPYHHTTGASLSFIGFCCAIISWGFMINTKSALNDNSGFSFDYDYGFWTTMAGWIANFVAVLHFYIASSLYMPKVVVV